MPVDRFDFRIALRNLRLDDLAAASDEPGLRPTGWELGIGRRRVLSPEGRDDATSRWLAGDTGPYMRNSVTNRSDFTMLFKRWAKISLDAMAELKAMSPIPENPVAPR